VKTKVRERIVRIQKVERVNPKNWDIRKLQESKEVKQKYQRKIEERIGENREEGNVEENWKRIEKVIKEVADEKVGQEEN
jgi:predicted GTPase